MQNFDDVLFNVCFEETAANNPKASYTDRLEMTYALRTRVLQALAEQAVKLAKEKSDD